MAATQQASDPGLTALEAVAALFAQVRSPDRGMDWLRECLLTATTAHGVVLLECVPLGDGERILYLLGRHPVPVERVSVGHFRALLASFVALGRRESGADLDPYGDRFTLRRGGVELHLDVANTPALQRLQIVRGPAAG